MLDKLDSMGSQIELISRLRSKTLGLRKALNHLVDTNAEFCELHKEELTRPMKLEEMTKTGN